MAAAGCRLYRHIRDMAFMGFAAVISHWREIHANFRIAREAILTEQPDILVLIDYPSFNLRMAKFCRRHLPQTKIYYYIPPKVWAWKRRRIHSIARLCDEVLGIFPFEPAFYAQYGYCLNTLHTYTFEGSAGFAKMQGIMAAFRTGLTAIGPKKVLKTLDYAEGLDGLPKSDVLKFLLDDNCSVVVRPSGTEPKMKAYISISAAGRAEAEQIEASVAAALEAFFA